MLSPFLLVALVLRSWLLRYAEAFWSQRHFVDGSSNRLIPQVFEYFFAVLSPAVIKWVRVFFQILQYVTVFLFLNDFWIPAFFMNTPWKVGWLCVVIFTKILSARCRATGRPPQAGEAIWALCHKAGFPKFWKQIPESNHDCKLESCNFHIWDEEFACFSPKERDLLEDLIVSASSTPVL